MEPTDILSLIRPLILAVAPDGLITHAVGGFGGFIGHRTEDLVGHNVFEFVDSDDTELLATYFLEGSLVADQSNEAESMPLPFRIRVLGVDGGVHPVDVMASRRSPDEAGEPWVVTLVPLRLQTALTRSLDAEMSGKSRAEVKQLLADELTVDDDLYCSRMFFVDLLGAGGVSVTPSRVDDHEIASAIRDAVIQDGWQPWADVDNAATIPLQADALPPSVAELAELRHWRRISATAVRLDGDLVAAYLFFGRAPAGFPVDIVLHNVAVRLERLVATTALIMTRWRERDRLMLAATSDPLTGLVNRTEWLANRARRPADYGSAVMYIDIDDFKAINDRYGHQVGDQVLVEVANRVVGACRPIDTVSRFGGDEFVVLLEDVDAAASEAVAQRILAAMSEPLDIPNGPSRVSVSVGLAADGPGGDVLGGADRAMLRAKRRGRARLEIDDSP